jgi:hypothetical protein
MAFDCHFGHLLDVLLNPLRKGADIEGLLRVGMPTGDPALPFGPSEPSAGGSVRPRFGSGAAALFVEVLFSFDKEKKGSLGDSCSAVEPSPVFKRSDNVPEPPASIGTGTAPAEGAERGVASSPPVGMVESLTMATVASFVCSDAIFGVPISAKTGHQCGFYALSGPRRMQP